MRILYFANNLVGLEVLRWLRGRDENVVGLVVHPDDRQRFKRDIVACAGLEPTEVFEASALRQPETAERLRALEPHIGVSVCFGYILSPQLLDLFPRGCINLHTGFLPYNRGVFPNVWSIVDRTSSGVTLHYIDRGVDTRDVVAQRPVPVAPVDTGGSLYRKLERASLELFVETWPTILSGHARRRQQDQQAGSVHRATDVAMIDRIDLERTYTARELIDVLRARTFPPYRGAYFEQDGRRIYVRVQLLYDEEIETAEHTRQAGEA